MGTGVDLQALDDPDRVIAARADRATAIDLRCSVREVDGALDNVGARSPEPVRGRIRRAALEEQDALVGSGIRRREIHLAAADLVEVAIQPLKSESTFLT